MKIRNIAFVGIPVTDINRARDFYEGVLGLKVSAEFGEGVWIEYEIDGHTLAIGSVGDQWKPSSDGTSVAVEVDNFEAAINHLKDAKVPFDAENVGGNGPGTLGRVCDRRRDARPWEFPGPMETIRRGNECLA